MLPLLTERKIAVDGRPVLVRVATEGDGDPFLLVHGLLIAGDYMVPFARHLAQAHPVVVPDIPPGSAPAQARVLVAVLDAMGLDRVHVVGNSFGCAVAVELARIAPERVRSLVLVGPAPSSKWLVPMAARLVAAGLLEPIILSIWFLRGVWRVGLAKGIGAIRQTLGWPLVDRLDDVATPAIVVRGGLDPLATWQFAVDVAVRLHGRLIELPHVGHAINYDAPAQLLDVVEAFLVDR